MRWLQGMQACQALGSKLASWSDTPTRADVYGVCARTSPGRCTIGLSDRVKEGTWVWEDGAPLPNIIETLRNRRNWDNCAKLEYDKDFVTGLVSAIGCNGEASAGNMRPLCRLGLGSGINHNFSDIVSVTDVPGAVQGGGSFSTGAQGSLALANGPYTVDSDLHVVVSYLNASQFAPMVQFFQIVLVPSGGGAPQVLRELAVGNGQAVVVNLGSSIPPGSTLKVLHTDPTGQQPGQPGAAPAAQYREGSAGSSATNIVIPGGSGLNNMKQVPKPQVQPQAGTYTAGKAVLSVTFGGPALPGDAPLVLYTLDGSSPTQGAPGTLQYTGNTTLPSSSGNPMALVVQAFKAGFAASSEVRVQLRINDAGCAAPTGLFCTQACSAEYFWCLSGKRIANQPTAPGTLCYDGHLVHGFGGVCSGTSTPTATLPAPQTGGQAEQNTTMNPSIPGNCSGFVPTNACVGKSDEFYCLDECSERRNCMYQCVGGGVTQQLDTPANTVCTQGRISNPRNEVCGWAGSSPAPGDWVNCDAAGAGIMCADRDTSCSDRFFECSWGGFVPSQPVAPGTLCHNDARSGKSRIVAAGDSLCSAIKCSAGDLGTRCGPPTSAGSTCSYTVNTCSNVLGQAQRTTTDLRQGTSLLVCESQPGSSNDTIVRADQASCGAPVEPVYTNGACTAVTAAADQVVVCDGVCSSTYTACSGVLSFGRNMSVPAGTLCFEGGLVHDYACGTSQSPPQIVTEEILVNETAAVEDGEPRVIIRPRARIGPVGPGTSPRSPRSLRAIPMRFLQSAPTTDLACIGVTLGITQGAGAGFGTVQGQAIVRSSIADIAQVSTTSVRIISGSYLAEVSICGTQPCPTGSTGSTLIVPVALPSLATATAPSGSLSAPFALPATVSSSDAVELVFDVCDVPPSKVSAVQGALADGSNYNIGSPVEVSTESIRAPEGGAGGAASKDDEGDGMSVGLIAGIAVAAVALVVGVVLLVSYILVRRHPDALARRVSTPVGPVDQHTHSDIQLVKNRK